MDKWFYVAEGRNGTFLINKMKIWLKHILSLIYKVIFNFARNEVNFMNT